MFLLKIKKDNWKRKHLGSLVCILSLGVDVYREILKHVLHYRCTLSFLKLLKLNTKNNTSDSKGKTFMNEIFMWMRHILNVELIKCNYKSWLELNANAEYECRFFSCGVNVCKFGWNIPEYSIESVYSVFIWIKFK